LSSAPVLGTQYVGPGAFLGPIPTFTLILTSTASARNKAVCSGFTQLPSLGAAQAANPYTVVSPLRWVLTSTDGLTANDCDTLLSRYDYSRAGMLLGAVAATTKDGDGNPPDTSGVGPYLLEQYADGSGLHFALLDFSKADDAQFAQLGATLAQALSTQLQFLSTNAPLPQDVQNKTDPATVAGAQAAKTNTPAWLQAACGIATNPVTKVLEAILTAAFPPSSVVITPLESVTNAGCASPQGGGGQGGQGGASTQAASATGASKKKSGSK
jgi:hypothetical protein